MGGEFDKGSTMDGHAESAPADGGLADLASFLDTPEEESTEETEATSADESTEAETGDDTEEAANAETDDDEADVDEPEADDEPAPERKLKVTVKGDDGTETVEEVPETELVKGYQRQSDYTRKTQELAKRENEAVQFLTQKHEEIRNQYLTQAEVSRAAVTQMAGLKSESEMAQLANSDPAAWVAESQRQRQITSFLSQLDQQIAAERQQANALAEQSRAQSIQQQFQSTWQKLSEQKIDRPALEKIFSDANKSYGFTTEELGNVYDHRMVMVLKDAAAYRALQSQKAEVTKRAVAAPRLPSKQNNPQTDRNKALETRFKSGRAKLSDLASFLN